MIVFGDQMLNYWRQIIENGSILMVFMDHLVVAIVMKNCTFWFVCDDFKYIYYTFAIYIGCDGIDSSDTVQVQSWSYLQPCLRLFSHVKVHNASLTCAKFDCTFGLSLGIR